MADYNDAQDLVDTAFAHVLAMSHALVDLKKTDPSDSMEDLPEGYSSYIDGSYQTAVLNLFNASDLVRAKITAAKGSG